MSVSQRIYYHVPETLNPRFRALGQGIPGLIGLSSAGWGFWGVGLRMYMGECAEQRTFRREGRRRCCGDLCA